MTHNLLFIISDNGLVIAFGGILSALTSYIIFRDKIHRKERKEQNEAIQKQFERMNMTADKSTDALKENTNILSGLKTLLEINIRK